MPDRRTRPIDLLAVGELLVDLISTEVAGSLAEAEAFARYQGGSPANLTRNLALLDNRAALIACVGNENLGRFLIQQLEATGVMTDHLVTDPVAPTSLVVVARSAGTADFIAYRSADVQLKPEHLPGTLLHETTLYHTTCFALSREPARTTILDGARRATEAGCTLTLDANYAPSIWGDREQARQVVAEYCRPGALVKLSRDDVTRLLGTEDIASGEAIQRFHDWGAALVCLTLGPAGSIISWDHGTHQERVAARSVEVADATGAGDAYWAGFLTAWLDGKSPPDCARTGSALAARKLRHIGPIPRPVSRTALYSDANLAR